MSLAYICEALLLSVSVCADTFAAAVSYGARQIKVPLSSSIVLSAVSGGVLAASAAVGTVIAPVFTPQAAKCVSFVMLFIIGCVRVFDSALKSWIRRSAGGRKVKFSAFRLNFLLEIYADPEMADVDAGGVLSPKESFFMALALSLDGLAAGFGAGAGGANLPLTALFSVALGFLMVRLGARVGAAAARKLSFDLSPAGGVMLIVLAFLKLL